MKAHPALSKLLLSTLLISASQVEATTFSWDASGGAPLNDGSGNWNATGADNFA